MNYKWQDDVIFSLDQVSSLVCDINQKNRICFVLLGKLFMILISITDQ